MSEGETIFSQRSRARRGRAIEPAGRSLPHSLAAEEFLLSCVMLDGVEVLMKCAKAGIRGDSFYDTKHGIIYETARALMAEGKPTESSVIAEELKARKQLDVVGGYAFLVQVSARVPTTAQTGYFIDQVRGYALRRALIREAQAAMEECFDGTAVVDEVAAKIENRILDVARSRVGATGGRMSSLPRLMPWGELIGAMARPEPVQLVEGMIHKGAKVMFGGGSKSFKTWVQLLMAICIAKGVPFWRRRTAKGRVLFVNFELDVWAFEERARSICEKLGIAWDDADLRANLVTWHLRGYAADLSKLVPQFLLQTMGANFDVIILDPIYKCLGERDENANGEVAELLNEVEALAVRTGAAVCFGHHFSKGNQAGKDAKDRVSGAGAWVRDPDAVVTLTPHKEENCFAVEFVLRNFKPHEPITVEWNWPIMDVRDGLNPNELREPGRPETNRAETLVDVLKREGKLTWGQLWKASKMSESTFKRKIEEAVKSGRIEHSGPLYFVQE